EINSSMLKLPDQRKACVDNEGHILDQKDISCGNLTPTLALPEETNCNDVEKVSCPPTLTLPEETSCNDIEKVSCPPTELGGCGTGLLDLRCISLMTLLKEMEVKAEEIVCSYDIPDTSDKSSSCSLCFDTDLNSNRYSQLQKAAERKDPSDNCLFCPIVLDINGSNFEHFQKHWGKGHPIVV
ncbi:lysine-specific demethylase 3B, partial [Trifolium pratense]